jgi:ribosomal protein S18 acetylase RimI-like enzyme
MTSEEASASGSVSTRSYILMKASTDKALELEAEHWDSKNIPSSIKVEQLQTDQTEAFVDLYNRCFLASPDPFCPLNLEQAKKLGTEGIFIAEIWGRMSGFIACFIEKEEEGIYGEITGIGVIPQRRRKGVATALIQKAVEYFIDAGVEEVYCEVYEENEPSKQLIISYGFTEVGRREIPQEEPIKPKDEEKYPGGKIMRRLGLRPRPGCETCRDL